MSKSVDDAVCDSRKDYVNVTEDTVFGCGRYRWITCGMGILMAVTSSMLSSNMSVAIVCMAKHPSHTTALSYNSTNGIKDRNDYQIVSRNEVRNKSILIMEENYENNPNKTNLLREQISPNINDSTYGGFSRLSDDYEAADAQMMSSKTRAIEKIPSHVNDVVYKGGVLPANDGDSSLNRTNFDDTDLNLLEGNRQCDAILKKDSSHMKTAEFTWDKITQSFVLSGFYYGYAVGQIPFGWLAGRYGGRHVTCMCMTLVSVITLIIPVLAKTDVHLVVVARVCTGLLSGAFAPSWYMLIGVWALQNERSRFSAAMWFGQILGISLGYTTSGLLCAHGFGNKWESIFYVQGFIGIVSAVCWWLLVYDSPRQHPRISTAELNLIEQHVNRKDQVRVPWRKILSYVPCWAMFITHFCDNCIYYLCITCLPLYMKEVLKFDIQSNGFFSSLPFLVMMSGTILSGCMADCVRSNNWMKVTNIRKMFQTIGLLGVATFIIIPGYLTCNMRAVVIVCLCLCTFCESIGNIGGYTSVSVDMAPRFASVIFAISNSIASLPGILAPLAVAELTKNETSEEWRVVFYIAAGVSIFAMLVFGVFSSSERAPWAEDGMVNDETDRIKPLIYDNKLKGDNGHTMETL